MAVSLSISEIALRFPDFRVTLVVAAQMSIVTARSAHLDALIAAREDAARARWAGKELSQIPGIAAWRSAYKGFGIKKTSYRSSVERLVKRVLAGERLPVVNTFVDIYNAVSLTHVFCCGADDLAKVRPPLAFRYARPGDSFIDMAGPETDAGEDPPKDGEVVYADQRHVLCRRWNWRQDARTGIGPECREAIITLQANGWGDLEAATADLKELLAEHCGARCRTATADAASPIVAV